MQLLVAEILTQISGIASRAGLLLAQAEIEGSSAVADAAADLAESAETGAQATNPVILFLSNPINLILISAMLFMFIVIRPQQKQMKQLQKDLAGLKKNDRVITASGIHGVVVQANTGDAVCTIRIDENSGARMTVNRESIAKIVTAESKT